MQGNPLGVPDPGRNADDGPMARELADALERLIAKYERAVVYLGSDEEWAKVSSRYFREVLAKARRQQRVGE